MLIQTIFSSYVESRLASQVLAAIICTSALPAAADWGCKENAGLPSAAIESQAVALGYRDSSASNSSDAFTQLGNGVVFEVRDDTVLVATAAHVLRMMCKRVSETSSLEFSIGRREGEDVTVSSGFDINAERCNEVEQSENAIDIAFFRVPKSEFGTFPVLVDSVLFSSAQGTSSEVLYYGFEPFPQIHSDRLQMHGAAPGNRSIAAIPSVVAPRWSGTPVYVSDGNGHGLTGIIIRSADTQQIYQRLSDQSNEISDKRVGVISWMTLRTLASDSRGIVLRIGEYDFSNWPFSFSDTMPELKDLLENASDMTPTKISSAANKLNRYSSLEQFHAAGMILDLLQKDEHQDQTIRESMPALLSILLTVKNWCFYNGPLETRVLEELNDFNTAYTDHEARQVLSLVENVQKNLIESMGVFQLHDTDAFQYADAVSSLLYRTRDPATLRQEFIEYGIVDNETLSEMMVTQAQLALVGLGSRDKYRRLIKEAIAVDPENRVARLASADLQLADAEKSEDLRPVVATYEELIEDLEGGAWQPDSMPSPERTALLERLQERYSEIHTALAEGEVPSTASMGPVAHLSAHGPLSIPRFGKSMEALIPRALPTIETETLPTMETETLPAPPPEGP